MKGQRNFDQFCKEKVFRNAEFSTKKYEAYLGILYWMRKNWHCAKLRNEFGAYERTECQKYRKYLDILYEYLYREFVGIPAVNPKFMLKSQRLKFENVGPLVYAVNVLSAICRFYFVPAFSELDRHMLFNLFNSYFEPKLLNEHRLNFGADKLDNPSKVTNEQQEMIIEQNVIDFANQTQTDKKRLTNYFEKFLMTN